MADLFTPILATLGYVMHPDGERVLLIRRDGRPEDPHFGKYNGLGGKLFPREDVATGMRREIREEAGIDCVQMRMAGTISWPGFGPSGEDWFGFLFRVDQYSGTPLSHSDEGTLVWVGQDEMGDLPLWEGDKHFLPLVFAQPLRRFHGVMPYEGSRPVAWSYSWCD